MNAEMDVIFAVLLRNLQEKSEFIIRMSEIGEAGPGEVTVFMNINWFYLKDGFKFSIPSRKLEFDALSQIDSQSPFW